MENFLDQIVYRKTDDFGSGFYGASRGSRTHKGQDFLTSDFENVYSPIDGQVTKLGYPYADDLNYRYIQIENKKYKVRLFYVRPCVELGVNLTAGDNIGFTQDIAKRYNTDTEKMGNHVHIEVTTYDTLVNPMTYFKETKSVQI